VSRLRNVTIWHVALLLPWVVAAASLRRKFNDNSYLWHVRAGDLQAAEGAVITADPFSFTRNGSPWRTQSWLAELFYSRLDGWFGLDGARVWVTVIGAVLFVLLGIIAYRRSRSTVSVAFYLLASVIVVAGFLVPRPAIFSFLLLAAVVVADEDRRLRWGLPLLMWVWASVHASFAIGLAYVGLRAIGRGLGWKRLIELVVVGLPTLLTAHGLGVFEILVDFFGNRSALNYLSEWAKPDLLSVPMLPVIAGLLTLIWLAARGRIEKADWWIIVPFIALAFSSARGVPPAGRIEKADWWIIVPFIALAFSSARGVPPAWIALAPILGRVEVPVRSRSVVAWPIATGIVALLLAFPFLLPFETAIDQSRFPLQAARHLETDRVFHDDVAGGWLVYSQWPQRRVFIDDRAEVHGAEGFEDLLEVERGSERWREVFARYSISEALISLSRGPELAEALSRSGWEETYRDGFFVVLRASGKSLEEGE